MGGRVAAGQGSATGGGWRITHPGIKRERKTSGMDKRYIVKILILAD